MEASGQFVPAELAESVDARYAESERLRSDHAGRVPTIVEVSGAGVALQQPYVLVPDRMDVGQFLTKLRKMQPTMTKGRLYFSAGMGSRKSTVSLSMTFADMYKLYCSDDGFLYCAVFGGKKKND